ncbi:MFS transporter [Ponticaulis sp.]|uniref:MFS transporter n=1 Tax=Ponticaulis sp. TaxID=2020902 RepID=UPI000B626F56|nr:MFS transporter [Ponticaulis sp.]MAI90051.1 MFS transporter [Ponticaulis sp.]OUX99707.1 MAG: hypothetical protein CBB65_06385 [Hyphomonadaceae bacterium TMED5]|tara:strand:- start:2149 stop:3540 length:1392 start_codon:yes stop_codon:yes gene_type:complete
MTVAAEPVETPESGSLSKSARSWSMYQGGRDTYVIVAGTYIFIPYFATSVVGDPVHGQSLMALYHLVSGLIVALTAPFLGAAIDQMGARKPWMFWINLLMVPMIAALWFAAPNGSMLPVSVIIVMLTVISVILSYGEVVYGAMLPEAATIPEQSKASGLALSLGNFVSIFVMLILLALLIPEVSAFVGLDKIPGGVDRFSVVLVALCLGLGTLPLLRNSHDAPKTGKSFVTSIVDGAKNLYHLIRHAELPFNPVLYLIARMFYINGKMALLIFGGVYAAGVMQWSPTELLVLGILVTIAGVFGGVFGGWLDTLIGPKRAFELEIAVTLLCAVAQLGVTPNSIFFVFPASADPILPLPMFGSSPELVYIMIAVVLNIFGTASWASSRTLMAQLAPHDQLGTFFGFYGLSGVATVWVVPLCIEFFTRVFESQRAGLVPASAFMLLGLVILFFVKSPKQTSQHPEA